MTKPLVTNKPTGRIADLSAPAALVQCLKASHKLLSELSRLKDEQLDYEVETVEKMAQIREQLVYQVFNTEWTESEVQLHQQAFEELEALDQQLRQRLSEVRDQLHKMRADNQHNRKAVNAYGQAKGQFSR